MKLSFSTLACPGYGFSDVCAMATDLGFDGIEVRGLGDAIFDDRSRPFAPENLAETAKKLSAMGLSIPCISTDCCLKHAELAEENKRIVTEYIYAAEILGAKYVRVLGDDGPEARQRRVGGKLGRPRLHRHGRMPP